LHLADSLTRREDIEGIWVVSLLEDYIKNIKSEGLNLILVERFEVEDA